MFGRRQLALVIVLMTVAAGCVGKESEPLRGAADDGSLVDGTLDKARPEAPQALTLLAPGDALPAWREVPLTVSVTGPAADVRVAVVDTERPASPCAREEARVPGDVTLTCVFTAPGERTLVARLTVLEDGAVAESAPVTITVGEGREPGVDVTAVRLLEGGGFEVDVPVDVVLVGFEEGTGDALQAKLDEMRLAHSVYLGAGAKQALPPHTDDPNRNFEWSVPDVPVVTNAVPRVTEAPPEIAAQILAFAAAAKSTAEGENLLDANAVEAFIATQLPRMRVTVDANRPALVLLHGGDVLPQDHAWAYALPDRTLAPVRVFGEKLPLLVLDASAREDPWVMGAYTSTNPVTGDSSTNGAPAYASPLPAGGDEAVDALAAAVKDATVLRLLAGPLYMPSTAPCHAVTTVLAVRATALTDTGDAANAVRAGALQKALEGVLGEGRVFVDAKVVSLPQDDPVLDALTRGPNAGVGAASRNDAIRLWLEENWADYWVPHEGCEAYVSFLVQGDVTDGFGAHGVAYHDPERGERVSLSWISDAYRFNTGSDGVAAANTLFAHETGHLVGLRHPHDENAKDVDVHSIAWSSTWNVMSYQTWESTLEFGAVNAANLARNRAAYLVQEAMAEGLTEEDPAFALALDHLSRFEWREAAVALEPAPGGEAGEDTEA